MNFRLTILFQQTTGNSRSGGWSENFCLQAEGFDAAFTKAQSLYYPRSRLLPTTGRIVGARMQNLSQPGQSQSASFVYPGQARVEQDVPQMSLLCTARSAGGNDRQLILRGVPDEIIKLGEYSAVEPYAGFLAAYFTAVANGFGFMGREEAQPLIDVISVSNVGVFKLNQNLTYNEGDKLKFFRTYDTFRAPVKGLFNVTVKVDDKNGTVANWVNAAVTRGKVRRYVLSFTAITSVVFQRAIIRKVGRPFFLYSGRQTKTR